MHRYVSLLAVLSPLQDVPSSLHSLRSSIGHSRRKLPGDFEGAVPTTLLLSVKVLHTHSIYIYLCVCMYPRRCTYAHKYIYTYIHLYTYYIHLYTYIHMYICYICTYLRIDGERERESERERERETDEGEWSLFSPRLNVRIGLNQARLEGLEVVFAMIRMRDLWTGGLRLQEFQALSAQTSPWCRSCQRH